MLVIENHAVLRRTIREEFELAGFEAYGARTGRMDLNQQRAIHLASLPLDLDLQDMSGVEVLDRLRSSSRVPVIIAVGPIGRRRQGAPLGAITLSRPSR